MKRSFEELLDILTTWFMQHGMKVNAEKTELMLCGDKRQLKIVSQLPDMQFMGECLQFAETVKNLGMIMDPELSWRHHVKQITSRCFGILISLFHARNVLPLDLLARIIDSLVMSQIRYCIQVFGSPCHSVLSEIQKVINFAARIISGRRKYDHISDVLQQLNWLNVLQLVAYFDLNLIHRILSTDRPMSLRFKLLYNHETVDRSTRQSSHLSLLRPKNNHGKCCYIYRASKLYNSIAIQNGLHENEMTVNRFKSYARMLMQQMWMWKSQYEKIALWYYLYLTKVQ